MSDERRPWERRDDESSRAYDAFGTYQHLHPTERSVDAAFRRARNQHQTSTTEAVSSKVANGQWKRWAASFDWVARARAWDDHLADIRRREQEAQWQRHVDEYAEQQRKLNDAALKAAVHLLAKAGQRLAAVEAAEIPLALLPTFFRTAAALAEAASDAQAQALAIADLLRLLHDQHRDG